MKLLPKRIYASTGVKFYHQDQEIPKTLSLEAELTLEAGAAEGDAPTSPSFLLVANSGSRMRLNGFYEEVVIDFEGAKFDKKVTPVIADHDVRKRIGHTTSQAIVKAGAGKKLRGQDFTGPVILAEGMVSSSMEVARGFVEDAKNGFPFQVSVGADILEAHYLEEGESAVINGKKQKGPLLVASKTLIRELSVTVLGADNNTSATIAAQRHPNPSKESYMNPEFRQWLEAMHLNVDSLSAEQVQKLEAHWKSTLPTTPVTAPAPVQVPAAPIQAAAQDDNSFLSRRAEIEAAHERHMDQIRAAFRNFQEVNKVTYDGKEMPVMDFKAFAMQQRLPVEKVELALMKSSLPNASSGPAIHMSPALTDVSAGAVSCALVRQLGMQASATQKWSGAKYGYEHWYDQRTLEASDHKDLRRISLHQLMDMTIRASGGYFGGNRKSDDFIYATREALHRIRAAGSGATTLDVTTIFEDAANKLLLGAYQSVGSTWQEIANVVNVSDFKTHNMYRMISKGSYHQVGVDGQLEHGEWDDQKYTISADTYGKMVGLDRRHIINDDLNAFSSIMSDLGMEAALALEEVVYVTWMASLASTYTAGNKNYISGATTDLDITGMTAASQTFRNQVIDGRPMLLAPDRLLVGTQDEIPAARLFGEARFDLAGGGATVEERYTNNPYVGRYRPIVTPYLNNTDIKQRVDITNLGAAIPNQTANQWFLFVNPNSPLGSTIMVALLNGNRTPFLERSDMQFDKLGLQWRAYHDFGVGLGDPKLSLMSKGAA